MPDILLKQNEDGTWSHPTFGTFTSRKEAVLQNLRESRGREGRLLSVKSDFPLALQAYAKKLNINLYAKVSKNHVGPPKRKTKRIFGQSAFLNTEHGLS